MARSSKESWVSFKEDRALVGVLAAAASSWSQDASNSGTALQFIGFCPSSWVPKYPSCNTTPLRLVRHTVSPALVVQVLGSGERPEELRFRKTTYYAPYTRYYIPNTIECIIYIYYTIPYCTTHIISQGRGLILRWWDPKMQRHRCVFRLLKALLAKGHCSSKLLLLFTPELGRTALPYD